MYIQHCDSDLSHPGGREGCENSFPSLWRLERRVSKLLMPCRFPTGMVFGGPPVGLPEKEQHRLAIGRGGKWSARRPSGEVSGDAENEQNNWQHRQKNTRIVSGASKLPSVDGHRHPEGLQRPQRLSSSSNHFPRFFFFQNRQESACRYQLPAVPRKVENYGTCLRSRSRSRSRHGHGHFT